MIRLSAFADEISEDLDEQIAVLKGQGIHHLDLRGVWGTYVLDLSDSQVAEIKRALDGAGIRVAAIGSPIGKTRIDSPFDEHMERFERALELAVVFETPYVRLFSFYPPGEGQVSPETYRDTVLERLQAMTERAAGGDIILTHENEKDIYGDTIARCVDLMRSVDSPAFVSAFDPANFIQCGQTPYPDAYEALRPWVRYVHVKDATADGKVVVAGEGEARWPELLQSLRADGYDGVFSLEPHLSEAGRYRGFSGPDLFCEASQAFQQLLRAMEWDYE